jgi:hypothetical protein
MPIYDLTLWRNPLRPHSFRLNTSSIKATIIASKMCKLLIAVPSRTHACIIRDCKTFLLPTYLIYILPFITPYIIHIFCYCILIIYFMTLVKKGMRTHYITCSKVFTNFSCNWKTWWWLKTASRNR